MINLFISIIIFTTLEHSDTIALVLTDICICLDDQSIQSVPEVMVQIHSHKNATCFSFFLSFVRIIFANKSLNKSTQVCGSVFDRPGKSGINSADDYRSSWLSVDANNDCRERERERERVLCSTVPMIFREMCHRDDSSYCTYFLSSRIDLEIHKFRRQYRC